MNQNSANPELNEHNIFKTTEVTLNIKPGTTNLPVFFDLFEGKDAETVEKVEAGCWCTTDPIFITGKLRVLYSDNSQLTPEQPKITFSRDITVYYNDGKEMKIKNARGVLVPNPFKAHTLLRMTINVTKDGK
jgi:hypothetical protein